MYLLPPCFLDALLQKGFHNSSPLLLLCWLQKVKCDYLRVSILFTGLCHTHYREDRSAKGISVKGFQSIVKTNVFKSGLLEGVLW